jgi:hypothetical protein
MSRTSRFLALACVAALTLAACGSSYKGLSKAEFVRQAVAICTKSDAKIAKIASIGNSPTIKQVKDSYAKQLLPLLNDEVDQLRALKPPKADREQVLKIFDDLSKGLDQASAEINALKSIKELGSLATPPALKAANAEAKAYRLGTCSDNSG